MQRPQSRLLRLIDSLGKFSLLDSFVMLIMVGGLEIKGVAEVHIGASFYVFVTATVLSILVGNYATHGWRRETTGRSQSRRAAQEAGARTSLLTSSSSIDHRSHGVGAHEDHVSSKVFFFGTFADYFEKHKEKEDDDSRGQPTADDGKSHPHQQGKANDTNNDNVEDIQQIGRQTTAESMNLSTPASPAQIHNFVSVRKRVVIPATILSITCVVLYGTQNLLTYHTGGAATLIVGTEKTVTLQEMLKPTGLYVTAVTIFTLAVAPVLYAATFPGGRFLGAWCATDAFLLSCVSGLLQLEQFVKFVLGGDESKALYSATASLNWPLALMCTLMVVCWTMLAADLLHIRCYRKEKKIEGR
jgi:hypothetical protein